MNQPLCFSMKAIPVRSAGRHLRKQTISSPAPNVAPLITGNAGSGKGIAIMPLTMVRDGNGRAKKRRRNRPGLHSRQIPPAIQRKYAHTATTTIQNLPSFVPAADTISRQETGHRTIRHRRRRTIPLPHTTPADILHTAHRLREGDMENIPLIMFRLPIRTEAYRMTKRLMARRPKMW